jgi:hypothetical protein
LVPKDQSPPCTTTDCARVSGYLLMNLQSSAQNTIAPPCTGCTLVAASAPFNNGTAEDFFTGHRRGFL